jgi:hypothetical protein
MEAHQLRTILNASIEVAHWYCMFPRQSVPSVSKLHIFTYFSSRGTCSGLKFSLDNLLLDLLGEVLARNVLTLLLMYVQLLWSENCSKMEWSTSSAIMGRNLSMSRLEAIMLHTFPIILFYTSQKFLLLFFPSPLLFSRIFQL